MMTIFQPFANTLWNTVKDTEITKVPKTDLRDTGDSYVLEADMPGFKKEEIKLSLEGDVLTIAAEHTTEKTAEGSRRDACRNAGWRQRIDYKRILWRNHRHHG